MYCCSGNVEAVQRVLAEAPRLLTAEIQGTTPLHWAASRRRAPVVELLLRAGADPLRRDRQGMTPLALAAARDEPDAAVVRLLLEAAPAAALAPDNDGRLPLHEAACHECVGGLRLLLEAAPEAALAPDKRRALAAARGRRPRMRGRPAPAARGGA